MPPPLEAPPLHSPTLDALDALIPTSARQPRWLLGLTWVLAMLFWPLIELLIPASWRLQDATDTLIHGPAWFALVVFFAIAVGAQGNLHAPTERRRGLRRPNHRLFHGVVAPQLALPLLTLMATAPFLEHSRWTGGWRSGVMASLAALGAAYLTFSTLRRIFDTLHTQPHPTTWRRNRHLHHTTRRLLTRLAKPARPRSPQRVIPDVTLRWQHRHAPDTHIAFDHDDLHLRVFHHAIEIQARQGHLPEANRRAVDDFRRRGVTLHSLSPTHHILTTRRHHDALTEAAFVLIQGWSRRAARHADEQPHTARDTWRPLQRSFTTSRVFIEHVTRLTAAALILLVAVLILQKLIIYPTWEGTTLWPILWVTVITLALFVHPARPWPRPRHDTRIITAAAAAELLEMLRLTGASIRDTEVSAPRPQPITRWCREGTSIAIQAPGERLHTTLWLRPLDTTAAGLELSEELILTADLRDVDQSAEAAADDDTLPTDPADDLNSAFFSDDEAPVPSQHPIERLHQLARDQDWPHHWHLTQAGHATLRLNARRVIGSGDGPWRRIGWFLAGDAVLVDDALITPNLVPVTSLRPHLTRDRLLLARSSWRGWRRNLALIALVLGIFSWPRISVDQFEPGVHPRVSLFDDAIAASRPDAGTSGTLADACPDAGTTSHEALLALRCLANAAGQEQPLHRLDWTALVEPLTQTLSTFASLINAGHRTGPLGSCRMLASHLEALFGSQQVRFSRALLRRYRAPTWRSLRFFWSGPLVEAVQSLPWDPATTDDVAHIDRVIGGCEAFIDDDTLTAIRDLYQLSTVAFADLLGTPSP